MAIEFDCPHCQYHYRLKDELAGKTATCKNAACRKKIVIPQPVTIPDDTPLPTPLDEAAAEAAALAALADEPPKPEQVEKKKVLDVECQYCNFKWTEPIERAGKNTICKNPECKQRIKIPEAPKEEILDWRQTRSKGPSLAKDNQLQKLEDVQDAGDAQMVKGDSLKKAGADGVEYEPRRLKPFILLGLAALTLLAGLGFGIRYLLKSRVEGKEDRLVSEAQDEFTKSTDTYTKEEVPLLMASLYIAGGEHAVRHNDKKKLQEALDQFSKARTSLQALNSPARNAMCAELAFAQLTLGGTEEQARDQVRIRWTQDTNTKYRPGERVFLVYEELRTTLSLVQGADPDFRVHLARRLTRELIKREQAAVALDLIPLALFTQPELPEAKAIVALEIYRADKASNLPKAVAEDLKAKPVASLQNPSSPTVQTLFTVLKTEKAPTLVAPPKQTDTSEPVRVAYTGIYLLGDDSKPDDAIKLAMRSNSPDNQLRALTMCADWAADSGPALDAALGVINANLKNKDVKMSPYFALRLSQIAAERGKFDVAMQFALTMTDESLKSWAQGDAVRIRLASDPKAKAEESAVAVTAEAKELRAGSAWARMWIARQNARISGDRSEEVKIVSDWPGPVKPFGKAGIALGLQDRDK